MSCRPSSYLMLLTRKHRERTRKKKELPLCSAVNLWRPYCAPRIRLLRKEAHMFVYIYTYIGRQSAWCPESDAVQKKKIMWHSSICACICQPDVFRTRGTTPNPRRPLFLLQQIKRSFLSVPAERVQCEEAWDRTLCVFHISAPLYGSVYEPLAFLHNSWDLEQKKGLQGEAKVQECDKRWKLTQNNNMVHAHDSKQLWTVTEKIPLYNFWNYLLW